MQNSVTAYIEYFKGIADSHSKIRDFDYGDSERILNRERTKIKYPFAWLEVPDFSPSQYEEEGTVVNGSLVVLHNVKKGDRKQTLKREEETYQIMKQYVSKLYHDNEQGEIELLTSKIPIEPIASWSSDNDLGWRINFSILVESGCYEEDVNNGVWSETE